MHAMTRYAAVLGAVVASQGAAAALHTRVVPQAQYPPANFDVCHPGGTIVYGDTYPPCLSQGEIEGKCAPPTQDAAGWQFQRDCMCEGSFFEDAVGCSACKQCNAIQGHSESAHWDKVFNQIKANFCQKATPTSNFGGYWLSALSAVGSPVPTLNDKRDRCAKVGDTAVENYYVATKSQGPGLARPTPTLTNVEAKTTLVATPAATQTVVAGGAKVELYAAATSLYGVAVITGTPIALGGPKFPLNATLANVDKAQVHYALASLPCAAAFVGGSVQYTCEPFTLIANSSGMVTSESAKAGALNFGACICAVEYLAPQNLRPVSGPVSPSGNRSNPAAVEIFSPKECTGPCHVPAPAAKVDEKTTPSRGEKHATSGPGESGTKASGEKPSEEKSSGEKPSGDKPSEDKPSGDKPSEDKPSGGKPSKDNDTPEKKTASDSSPSKDESKPAVDCGEDCPPAAPGTSKGGDKAKPAPLAPADTGAPVSPAAGLAPVTAGAVSTGASAAVLAVAFAVYAL